MQKISFLLALALAACTSSEDAAEEEGETTALALESFTVQPGSQGLKCQTFANPTGEAMDVAGWSSLQTAGGHHVLVFAVEGATDAPMEDCEQGPQAPGDGQVLVFQSQSVGESAMVYPAGVTARVPATHGFLVQIHYLNASDQALTVENQLSFTRAAQPGEAVMAPVFFDNRDLHIPPGGITMTRTCTVAEDVDVVWLASHMHTRGVEFTATVDGEELYRSDQPEGRSTVFDPVRPVPAGTELTFACRYENETDGEIRFGPSLEDDEMCNMVGAYVDRDGRAALLSCESSSTCLSCSAALFGDTGEPCTDGDPSSADKLGDLQACTCGADAPCADACAASGCAGTMPDDACSACLGSMCGDPLDACLSD